MKIEYEKLAGLPAWQARYDGRIIGRVMVQSKFEESEELQAVYAADATVTPVDYIPGSPFETVNQAKAALEYHFRNLTETE